MKKWCVILGLVLVVFVFGCNIKVSLNEMQVVLATLLHRTIIVV